MDPALIGQVAIVPGADNLVGWLICRITGSHSRHMFVITGPQPGQDPSLDCVSADAELDAKQVRQRRLTDFPTAIISKFDLTPAQRADVVAYALAQVGKPYAYLDDALIALERIGRFRFPACIRERFAYDGQLQCAQLCDFALNAAGVHVFDDDRLIGDVFPGSFEQEYIKRRWYTAAFFASFPLLWHTAKASPQPLGEPS